MYRNVRILEYGMNIICPLRRAMENCLRTSEHIRGSLSFLVRSSRILIAKKFVALCLHFIYIIAILIIVIITDELKSVRKASIKCEKSRVKILNGALASTKFETLFIGYNV